MSIQIECVVDSRSELGEGAVWDAQDQCLWWVDIMGELVHRFYPETGKDESWRVGEPVGCLAVRASGGLVLATKTGFYTFDPETGGKTAIVDPEAAGWQFLSFEPRLFLREDAERLLGDQRNGLLARRSHHVCR